MELSSAGRGVSTVRGDGARKKTRAGAAMRPAAEALT
jgi:hypothetical protein